MQFVDTHLHLEEVDDPDAAVAEAVAAGVTRLITVGTDLSTSRQALERGARSEPVFAAAGHHPANSADPDLPAFRELLGLERVVAVGEIGLDGSTDQEYALMERQLGWFGSLCDLALEFGLPVSVHVRDAAELAHGVLSARPGLTGVMHYFSLDQEWAERFLELGFHLSFAGLVTRAMRAGLREVARTCPADRLLLETDSPFGQPAARKRERQNRPAFLLDTAAVIAEVRGISLEELAEIEWHNAHALFKRLPS
jgi:TatD DNase family protein